MDILGKRTATRRREPRTHWANRRKNQRLPDFLEDDAAGCAVLRCESATGTQPETAGIERAGIGKPQRLSEVGAIVIEAPAILIS